VPPHLAHLVEPPAIVAPAPPPPPSARARTHVSYGYLPYWSIEPDEVPWERLSHLAVFSVGVASDGTLTEVSRWTDRAEEAVALGHAAGVRVHLCVTAFDEETQLAVLPDAGRRATLVAALGEQVDAYGADGVNVDFEGVPGELRDELVAFTRELKARVGEVFLATPAVDWSDAWDYAALTAESDGLFVMGYGYHWTGGSPGPNAPLDAGELWSRWTLAWTVDDYLAKGADPARVVMGLPLYGQGWPVADASVVPAEATDDGWAVVYADAVAEAEAAGRQWEPVSVTPWYAAGASEQVWYDDAASLDEKVRFAVDAGLGGVGWWAIGYDANDPALWDAVDAATTTEAPPADTGDVPEPAAAKVVDTQPSGCGCGTGAGVHAAGLAVAAWLARRRQQWSYSPDPLLNQVRSDVISEGSRPIQGPSLP
jgi:hypothetical protein